VPRQRSIIGARSLLSRVGQGPLAVTAIERRAPPPFSASDDKSGFASGKGGSYPRRLWRAATAAPLSTGA